MLWDTFRSAHPLYTLIETERTREFIETFLAHYTAGGPLALIDALRGDAAFIFIDEPIVE